MTDFADPKLPEGWTIEGEGFEHGWVEVGTPLVALEGESLVSRLLPRGIHSHALSSKLPGVLRMPAQHVVPGSQVSVKLAGGEYAGTLIMDENTIQNESISFLNQLQPAWRSYGDLPLKNGITRVTIDFATSSLNSNFPPRTGLAAGLPNTDFGFDKRSWLSITQIVTHDAPGAPLDLMDWFCTLFDGETPTSTEALDMRIGLWMRQALARWCDRCMHPGDSQIVDWMLSKKL
ncbi:MAG: hypothetical protein ACKO8U_10720, partial [Pirellula sp.]